MVAVPAFAQSAGVPATAKSTYALCTKAPSPEEQDKGHTAYTLGKEKYDKGKLEEAVTFFKDAYERDCQNHDYLIIISRAYERQPNLPEAILALETYVQRAPNAPDIDKHRANIDSMKQRQKAAAATATTPPTVATTPPTTAPTTAPPTPPSTVESGHTIWPWVVAGAGVVALGTGLAFILADPAVPEGCQEGSCDNRFNDGLKSYKPNPLDPNKPVPLVACTNDSTADGCFHSQYNIGRRNQAGTSVFLSKAGPITMVGGGVLVVGGVIWYFAEPKTKRKESGFQNFQITPVVMPGYSGMAMGARF